MNSPILVESIKRVIPIYAFFLVSALGADTLTIDSDLDVVGTIQAGSTTSFGRLVAINDSSYTIGAITSPSFENAFVYIGNPGSAGEMGIDPNQIVANISSDFNIWNANASGGIVFRTGGSDSESNAVFFSSSGYVGAGVSNPLEKLHLTGALLLGNTTNSNVGAIRFNGTDFQGYKNATEEWVSLTSGSATGGSGEAYKLTTPDENTDAVVVDSNGDTTVYGALYLSAPQGDIPMFGQ